MTYQIPKRPTEPVEFTLAEHIGKEDAPVFTLKPLACEKHDEFHNLATAGKQATALRYACLHGIKGWANLVPEFNEDNLYELLKSFNPLWLVELGGKINDISTLSDKQKN